MAGIEEAFEKFSDRLAREESKRYSKDEQGDYVEEVQDPYPIKLGPLELGANANMSTGKFSPNEYQNVSTMNRNVGLRGKYNIPDSGIALLGSIGDVRSNQKVKTDLPFNPMTGEASPYSEMRKDVYKDSPYSVGAQYNPQGTDEMYSALYNKGGGYNLGYNKGPVNVSYTSNPGLGNNVMLRGQYNFADGGVASMFRERPGYQEGGFTDYLSNPLYQSFLQSPFYDSKVASSQVITPITLPSGQILNLPNAGVADQFKRYLNITPQQRPDDLGLPGQENLREETLEEAMNRGEKFFDPIGGFQVNPLTGGRMGTGIDPNFIAQRAMQAEQDAAARTSPVNVLSRGVSSNFLSPNQSMQQDLLMRAQSVQTGGTPQSVSEGSTGISPLFRINRLIQAEQDAAARVTPTRMASGGRVSMSDGGLTTTIAPAKGPDSQGVESLFRRRYN